MSTIAGGLITSGKLITYGICLGIGFWAARKLTNVADEYLMRWDTTRMNKFARDVESEIGAAAAGAGA